MPDERQEQDFTVTFHGFKSLKHAETFVSWYCGSGEQESYIWLEEQGMLAVFTDVYKTYGPGGELKDKDDRNVNCYLTVD